MWLVIFTYFLLINLILIISLSLIVREYYNVLLFPVAIYGIRKEIRWIKMYKVGNGHYVRLINLKFLKFLRCHCTNILLI